LGEEKATDRRLHPALAVIALDHILKQQLLQQGGGFPHRVRLGLPQRCPGQTQQAATVGDISARNWWRAGGSDQSQSALPLILGPQ
jgi:hypothetical protein